MAIFPRFAHERRCASGRLGPTGKLAAAGVRCIFDLSGASTTRIEIPLGAQPISIAINDLGRIVGTSLQNGMRIALSGGPGLEFRPLGINGAGFSDPAPVAHTTVSTLDPVIQIFVSEPLPDARVAAKLTGAGFDPADEGCQWIFGRERHFPPKEYLRSNVLGEVYVP